MLSVKTLLVAIAGIIRQSFTAIDALLQPLARSKRFGAELEADAFARALLMPRRAFFTAVDRGLTTRQLADHFQVDGFQIVARYRDLGITVPLLSDESAKFDAMCLYCERAISGDNTLAHINCEERLFRSLTTSLNSG